MKQLSQNISSTCRGDNVDIKYTTTTTLASKNLVLAITHPFTNLFADLTEIQTVCIEYDKTNTTL